MSVEAAEFNRRLATAPLPPFFTLQPVHWFLQTEEIWGSVRSECPRADDIRFEVVVRSLGSDLELVADLVCAPPVFRKYDTLKKTVLERAAAREKAHLASLIRQPFLSALENLCLEKRRPTELLAHMKSLLPHVGDEWLLALWIRKLPVRTQCRLARMHGDVLLKDDQLQRATFESLDREVLEEYPDGYWEDSEAIVRKLLDGYQAELAALELERCQISTPNN